MVKLVKSEARNTFEQSKGHRRNRLKFRAFEYHLQLHAAWNNRFYYYGYDSKNHS